jgi:hypothetical protein
MEVFDGLIGALITIVSISTWFGVTNEGECTGFILYLEQTRDLSVCTEDSS